MRGAAAAVQDPEVTSRIRKVFNSQEGLTGIVTSLPLDMRFRLENVKVVGGRCPCEPFTTLSTALRPPH